MFPAYKSEGYNLHANQRNTSSIVSAQEYDPYAKYDTNQDTFPAWYNSTGYDPHANRSNTTSLTPRSNQERSMARSLKSHSAENHFTERRQKIMKNITTIRSQLVAASTNEEKELFESTMKLEVAALQRLNESHSNYIRDPSKYNFPKNAGTAVLRQRSMKLTEFKARAAYGLGGHLRVIRALPPSLFVGGPLHSIEITFKMVNRVYSYGLCNKGKVCLAILQDGKIHRTLVWSSNDSKPVWENYKISYRPGPEQQGLKYGLCCRYPKGENNSAGVGNNSLKVWDIVVTTFTYT